MCERDGQPFSARMALEAIIDALNEFFEVLDMRCGVSLKAFDCSYELLSRNIALL